jgi:hypothetical protein
MSQLPPMRIVLHMEGHGSATVEDHRHGGAQHYRYLNSTGRWSAAGTSTVPLLTWPNRASATEAAEVASRARKRPIAVSTVSGSAPACFQQFADKLQPALLGYLPYTEAARRKLEVERQRTMTYVRALVALADGQAIKDANAAVRASLGSGTVVQAAQFLTGKRCADIVQRILDGELECDAGLTPSMLVAATSAARGFVDQLGRRDRPSNPS